ncbi:MAG TPA: LysM domain-containing protein [Bacillota bacterium]|nr:LysM domain-containing protein [Bacillota bacterium]
MIRHTVQPGETIGTIAARYGTTVRAIAEANPGVNINYIYVGQTLRIPVSQYPPGPPFPPPVPGPGPFPGNIEQRLRRLEERVTNIENRLRRCGC